MEQNRRHAGVIVYEVLNAATATQYRLQTQMLLSARQDLVLDMRRLRTISAEGYLFLQDLVQAAQAYDGRVFFSMSLRIWFRRCSSRSRKPKSFNPSPDSILKIVWSRHFTESR